MIFYMFPMPGESDLVESFMFRLGRIQIPLLTCLFDFVIRNKWCTEVGIKSVVFPSLSISPVDPLKLDCTVCAIQPIKVVVDIVQLNHLS